MPSASDSEMADADDSNVALNLAGGDYESSLSHRNTTKLARVAVRQENSSALTNFANTTSAQVEDAGIAPERD